MFCVKCGHPMEDGDDFCANCGAEAEKNILTETEEELASDVQTDDAGTAKKSANPLLLITAGVVVLAAIVVLLLNFGTVKSWFVRSVTSPEELLKTVYKTSAAECLSPVLESYGKAFDSGEGQKLSSQAQIVLKPGETVLDTVALALYGGEADMSWLSDVRLETEFSIQGSLQKNVIGLGLGENDIVSLEMITDSENQKQYLTVPELSEQSLLMDMSQNTDISSVDMTKLYDAMPSGQVIQSIAERYMDILLGGFSNVEKKTETLTLDPISQEVTVLEAYIDHVDLLEVAIAVLEQAKQDEDLKAVLEDLGPWYNDMMEQSMAFDYEYSDTSFEPLDLYAEMIAGIDASLAELQEQLADADPENYLYLYTYLDQNNGIIGIKLVVSGMEEPVSCLTLTQDGQFVSEILFGDMQVNGSGNEADSLNGSYTVSVESEKLLDVKLENITQTSGVVYLEPSAALLAGIAEDMGMDAGMVSMADVVLRISAEGTDENSQCTISVLSNEVSLFELDISGEMKEFQEFDLPVNVADSSDEEASYSWLMGLDIAGLITNLTEAGVPEELFTAMMG